MSRTGVSRLLASSLRPPLADRRFWVVQAMVIVFAAVHETIDISGVLNPFSGADIVPVALFLVPVVYAALNFGLTGSFATAGLVTLLTVPDTLLVRQEAGPWPDLLQLLVIDVVAFFVGHRVERERLAREVAERAEERLRALFETNQAPILAVAGDGTVSEANPAAVRLFGARARSARLADLVGRRAAEIMDSSEAGEVVVAGRTFHCRVSSVGEAGGRRLLQVVLEDVTEERRRQRRVSEYAKSVIRGHEEERRRIAQELHDEPVQELVHLLRLLDLPPGATPEEALRAAGDARKVASQTLRSLREMSRGLRPSMLDDLGLGAALRRLAAEFAERSGVDTSVEVQDCEPRLDADVELGIFRIAQEALHNAEHHAGARRATVRLTAAGGVRLTISDDGRGFDVGRRPEGSLGLLGMQERAQLLGGRLQLRSRKGRGTTVELEL